VIIFVAGLWHLGSVTAACMAKYHRTIGFDPQPETVAALQRGVPPLFEPQLAEAIDAGLRSGNLTFTSDRSAAREADVVWIAYDTPVDGKDRADVDFVAREVESLYPHLKDGALLLVSSQAPSGFIRRLEASFAAYASDSAVSFAYSPENLRLGEALQVFLRPDRIVVGVRAERDRALVAKLFAPISENIVWMSPESAEMTKHAINGFLATSVTFMNEIAAICERVGADAREVERGLRTESRIGSRAYVTPGTGFAGGTLARDIQFLTDLGRREATPVNVISSVLVSNEQHKAWVQRRLRSALGELAGTTVALLGLTYKPGTDTLRRSSAVELARDLHERDVRVSAFDPAVKSLPVELHGVVSLESSVEDALRAADAVVVTTDWPEFREISASTFIGAMRRPIIVDPKRFLESILADDARVRYIAVGRAAHAASPSLAVVG
jgi:UDPglucose 6-dehydrogenase